MSGNSDFLFGGTKPLAPCIHCGAILPGGTDGCHLLYKRVLDLQFGDPAYGAVHLLTVDSYTLQHSNHDSLTSSAFHLIRLCWLLEQEGDASVGQEKWLSAIAAGGFARFPFLKPPGHPGELTIADILDATSAKQHAQIVRDWAWSVWEAWEAHHQFARQWIYLL